MGAYFEWGLDPEIIHIAGPFGLRWYSLCFISGILLGHYFFGKMLSRSGKPVELRDHLLYYIVVGTILGARLGHVLFYDPGYYFSEPLRVLKVWEGGLASHGGFSGVMVALWLFSRKHRELSFFWLTDRISIVAILAGACIRIGNFFNSEVIGRITDVPWAIVFLNVDNHPRHPSQLYESFGYFCISLLLYLVYRAGQERHPEGRIFGLALSVGFSFRFVIEFLKEHQVGYEDGMLWNMGQMLSIPFVVAGLFLVSGWPQRLRWLSWAFSPASRRALQGGGSAQGKTMGSRHKSQRKAKGSGVA